MKYKAILRDSIIITDDYADEDIGLLIQNLTKDFVRLGIDYPVPVLDEKNRKVFEARLHK